MKKALSFIFVLCALLSILVIMTVSANATQPECPDGNHTLTEKVLVSPTCKYAGTKQVTCTVCGYKETRWIAKTEHTFKSKTLVSATCKYAGTKQLTCSKCGYKETRWIAKTGHNFKAKILVYPTCKYAGTKQVTCTMCGYKETRWIAKTEHKWKAANCKNPKTCSVCGATEGKATGKHTYKATIVKYPTCGAAGSKKVTCTVCGYSYTETIAATGNHVYVTDSYGDKKCSVCGAECVPIIKLKNSLPATFYDYYTSGRLHTSYKLESVTFGDYGSNDVTVTFKGTCTYNSNGAYNSTNMCIGYKLYDEKGYVVESGTTYTSTVKVGEKFMENEWLYGLEGGHTYYLEILNTY